MSVSSDTCRQYNMIIKRSIIISLCTHISVCKLNLVYFIADDNQLTVNGASGYHREIFLRWFSPDFWEKLSFCENIQDGPSLFKKKPWYTRKFLFSLSFWRKHLRTIQKVNCAVNKRTIKYQYSTLNFFLSLWPFTNSL